MQARTERRLGFVAAIALTAAAFAIPPVTAPDANYMALERVSNAEPFQLKTASAGVQQTHTSAHDVVIALNN